MTGLWVGLLILLAITAVAVLAHARPAGNRTPAVFDCGVEDCRYRNRSNHRHRSQL